MKIPSELTDENFVTLVEPKEAFHNTNEMLGELSQLTNNLHASLHIGNNQVTSEVLGILAGINAMTITASRSYIHKNAPY